MKLSHCSKSATTWFKRINEELTVLQQASQTFNLSQTGAETYRQRPGPTGCCTLLLNEGWEKPGGEGRTLDTQ